MEAESEEPCFMGWYVEIGPPVLPNVTLCGSRVIAVGIS